MGVPQRSRRQRPSERRGAGGILPVLSHHLHRPSGFHGAARPARQIAQPDSDLDRGRNPGRLTACEIPRRSRSGCVSWRVAERRRCSNHRYERTSGKTPNLSAYRTRSDSLGELAGPLPTRLPCKACLPVDAGIVPGRGGLTCVRFAGCTFPTNIQARVVSGRTPGTLIFAVKLLGSEVDHPFPAFASWWHAASVAKG